MEIQDISRSPWFKNYSESSGPSNEWVAKREQRKVTGSFLDKPNLTKFNERGRGNGLRFGVSCMQGWRGECDFSHCALSSLGQDRGTWSNTNMIDWSYFGVFDGHAGHTVSNYCADQLLGSIIYSPEFQEDVIKGIRAGFLRLDGRFKRLPDLASGKDKSSSTAVCALVSPLNIYVAHCGDSRAVLCRDGKPVFETIDHKPCVTTERERIHRAGGTVSLTDNLSALINVSRSFGDFRYKRNKNKNLIEQILSPEPDIHIHLRNLTDSFMILACNGVWDVMSAPEVCSYVDHLLHLTDDLEFIGNCLLDTCLYKGSKDSMSVIIITFTNSPRIDDKSLFKEKRLDCFIDNKIREIISKRTDDISLSEVIKILQESSLPYLPPGGGFSAKLALIETVYNGIRPYNPESALYYNLCQSPQLDEVILY